MIRIGRGSTVAVAGALVLVLASACEKAGDSTEIQGSGELSATEKALFAVLPAGSNMVFGGNYQKLMKYWETSPFKKLSESFLALGGQTDGMREYMTCWVERQSATDLAGSLEVRSNAIGMTMVFRGVDEKILTACAERGGMKFTRDPDG